MVIGQYGARGHHVQKRVVQAQNNDNGIVQTQHPCMAEKRVKERARRQVNATLGIVVVSFSIRFVIDITVKTLYKFILNVFVLPQANFNKV